MFVKYKDKLGHLNLFFSNCLYVCNSIKLKSIILVDYSSNPSIINLIKCNEILIWNQFENLIITSINYDYTEFEDEFV